MRATQWQGVKERLEYSRRHTKKEIKVFEKFFVKDLEPDWDQVGSDPIPLVYRLWFSPDHSRQAWQKIVDKVFTYHDWQVENSIRETWDILNQELGSDRYCGDQGSPVGFIGGEEEEIFKFLTGDFSRKEFLTYAGERLFVWRVFNVGFYLLVNRWLKHSEYANPYNIFHYMYEFWYEAMSTGPIEEFVEEDCLEFFKEYLVLIAKGVIKNDVNDASRLTHCQNVFQILESRPVPQEISAWWADAKEEAEKG